MRRWLASKITGFTFWLDTRVAEQLPGLVYRFTNWVDNFVELYIWDVDEVLTYDEAYVSFGEWQVGKGTVIPPGKVDIPSGPDIAKAFYDHLHEIHDQGRFGHHTPEKP